MDKKIRGRVPLKLARAIRKVTKDLYVLSFLEGAEELRKPIAAHSRAQESPPIFAGTY